jgi:hypothetical protein
MQNSCQTEDLSKGVGETKVCFGCFVRKPLSAFKANGMKHKIKSDLGVCSVCKDCDLLRTLRTLKNVRYNFEIKKFEVNTFQNPEEVVKWYAENENL